MTLLAKPSEIVKGLPTTFTLDKVGLSELPAVQADDYFKFIENWSEICLVYRSATGAKEEVRFDANLLHPQSDFYVTARARGEYTLEAIFIYDFDNDMFMVTPGQLPVEQFELAFSPQALPFLSDWVSMSKIFSLSEDYVAY